MDKQFEGDVMQDLMEDSPVLSADDGFEDEAGEEFEGDGMEDDAMLEGMDAMEEGFEEGEESFLGEEDSEADLGDEFAEEGADAMDALEEAVADALDAEDSDEFLSRLISGVRRVAGLVGRGAGAVRRAAGTAQRVAGRVGGVARRVEGAAGGSLPDVLRQLLPLLQQGAAQGADGLDLFEDLADWYETEDADEALPVLAGVVARAALRPLARQGAAVVGRNLGRQLVRQTTQAARALVRRQGPQAVRALRPIARSVGRAAARRSLRPAALPAAIRKTASRVAAQPRLAQRLSRPARRAGRAGPIRSRLVVRGGTPRRFVIPGPVEIRVIRG